jgi:hypothetical protein
MTDKGHYLRAHIAPEQRKHFNISFGELVGVDDGRKKKSSNL